MENSQLTVRSPEGNNTLYVASRNPALNRVFGVADSIKRLVTRVNNPAPLPTEPVKLAKVCDPRGQGETAMIDLPTESIRAVEALLAWRENVPKIGFYSVNVRPFLADFEIQKSLEIFYAGKRNVAAAERAGLSGSMHRLGAGLSQIAAGRTMAHLDAATLMLADNLGYDDIKNGKSPTYDQYRRFRKGRDPIYAEALNSLEYFGGYDYL